VVLSTLVFNSFPIFYFKKSSKISTGSAWNKIISTEHFDNEDGGTRYPKKHWQPQVTLYGVVTQAIIS
jgi:hypothetical protein